MSNATENAEPIAGTNLTTIKEFNATALALQELEQRLAKVVADTSTKKGVEALTKDVAELRGLRTGVEKKRKELKAPLIEQEKKLDAEAARITGKIVALEEPLKNQLDEYNNRIEAEKLAKDNANRERIERLTGEIRKVRDLPSSLVGQKSFIIAGQLATLEKMEVTEDVFAEYFDEMTDAIIAGVARIKSMHTAALEAEAEAERVQKERAELELLRKQIEERADQDRQREAEETAKREAAEKAEREEQERKDREAADAERARVEAIDAGINAIRSVPQGIHHFTLTELDEEIEALKILDPRKSSFDFQERRDDAIEEYTATMGHLQHIRHDRVLLNEQRDREQAEKEQREAELQAQAEQQKIVEQQQAAERDRLAKLAREAAEEAERARLAGMGLRDAASAVLSYWMAGYPDARQMEKLMRDLSVVLANEDTKPSPRKRTKAVK